MIHTYSGKMNEAVMIEHAKQIEAMLIEQCAKPDTIKNVFVLFVETVQNILNYAYGAIEGLDLRKEAECSFRLSYRPEEKHYVLESANLVDIRHKELIEERVSEIKGISQEALKELTKQRIRLQQHRHNKGAGLGYIMMARRTQAPIETLFTDVKEGVYQYRQKLVV